MRYSETGYNLEIDLTTGNVERVETDPKDTEFLLGGVGTSSKIMWDRVGPEVKPFDPENLLIFSSGLLCGTSCPGANRTMITSVSPQTDFVAYSMMGGFFSPEMKYAGYDKIIFRGKSPKLVYIWIKDDKVEIRDASHLSGKGSVETQELIRQELKEPRAHVAAIGLAGENRVFFASIEQGRSSASRLGLGAVMGDKGIKAIAIRGTKDLNVARPAELIEINNWQMEYMWWRQENPIPKMMPIMAILGSPQEMLECDEKWHTENFSWGNSRVRRKNFWTPEIEEAWTRQQLSARKRLISCYNCPIKCGALISVPGVAAYMMKCFTKLTYAMGAFVDDLEWGLQTAGKAIEYGVDGFSCPQVVAYAFELKEAGILTEEDFAGTDAYPPCPEDNAGRFLWMLDRIVRREGIGNIFADGTYWAGKTIGKGAEKYAHNNIRKHEQAPLKLGAVNPIYYLMYCTNEKLNITQIEGQWPQMPYSKPEDREAYVKDWFQVPDDRFKEWFKLWEMKGEHALPYFPGIPEIFEIVDWMERMHLIDDMCGVCTGISAFHLKPPYHIHNYPKIISAATGMDISEEELIKITKRDRQLIRANNVRRGWRQIDDMPPEDHWAKRLPEYEKQLLEGYQAYKGWDTEGIPTKESLESLDLGFVAEDFEKRGIF
ncbi:aldehyde ferredoxin oxidoreductase N-terminal domain-containing protein [Syntrophus aciditrophicus]|uniref:Aldehyde dehydrogenase (Ferredoxin) n=1 Tax=Syntrophus aciditrophicus (strain SB) TaxID=56780 RepID=Q2LQ04_SYNAS|nr:aldehyde ferredoxin oxidoreductase N-terminal domain-containing protein [Syntrophus aciditrophicus]ABC76356.1 aldehyde dehydrogenase (ferredoxin) [Syntrophus aciditrophicus SB]